MAPYISRRLSEAVVVLFGLSFIAFAFVHLLPGGPERVILGLHATPQAIARLRQELGLNDAIWIQYWEYLITLFHGDFGNSIINNQPVIQGFAERFPSTLELTGSALVIAIGLGLPLGRLAARHFQRPVDASVTVASLLLYSVPVFVLGLVCQYVFSVRLGWMPTSGEMNARLNYPTPTHFSVVDALLSGNLGNVDDAVKHLVLPAVALASGPLALFARITRASVLEIGTQDYVRTARAKGLTGRRINRRHVMRNAWLPLTTVIGLQVGSLLGGAVLTETVFSWNGIGSWLVTSVQNRDYPVVQSVILIVGTIFILTNVLVDVGYGLLNPKLRHTL